MPVREAAFKERGLFPFKKLALAMPFQHRRPLGLDKLRKLQNIRTAVL
jgi:hypothetical protein